MPREGVPGAPGMPQEVEDFEFTVVVDRTDGHKLGMKWRPVRSCDGGFLAITAETSGGLFQQWNEDHPALAVRSGDRIVEVNGIRNDVDQLRSEVNQHKILELRVKHVKAEDVPCGESAAAALGSHLELQARLLHLAAPGEGLQALRAPLLASSAQLCRGLEACRTAECEGVCRRPAGGEVGRRQSMRSADGEDVCRRPGDALPASGRKGPQVGFSGLDGDESEEEQEGPREPTNLPWVSSKKSVEWAEDQIVLQELRENHSNRTTNFMEHHSSFDSELIESASWAFCCLRRIVGNARFEVFWAAVVMVNTCTMILEEEWTGLRSGNRIGVYEKYGSDEYMDQWWPSAHAAFFAIDCVFSLMFTVELILTFTYDIWNRLLGFGFHFRHPFWTNPWDWLDFLIVVSSNLWIVVGIGAGPLGNARFLRIFRLVRLLRLVRLVRKVNSLDPLHLMTTAIRGSAMSLVFSIGLLLLIQTIIAMILTQVLRYSWLSEGSSLSEDVQMQLFRYFGTYTRSMVTMFELMLANYPTVGRFLMDDVHEAFGCLVLLYKLAIGFAVIGVINGVFIQETFSVAQNDEFIMVRKRIRQMEHHKKTISRLFKIGDKDNSDTLNRDEFCTLLQKDFIRTYLEAMDLRCSDPDMLFTLIAGDGHEVTLDEFVAGMGRLKGTARNVDVIAVLDILQQHQRTQMEQQRTLMRDLTLRLEDINHIPPKASRRSCLAGVHPPTGAAAGSRLAGAVGAANV